MRTSLTPCLLPYGLYNRNVVEPSLIGAYSPPADQLKMAGKLKFTDRATLGLVEGEIHPGYVGVKRRALINSLLHDIGDPTKPARQEIIQATRRFGKTEFIRQILGRSSHYPQVTPISIDGQVCSSKYYLYLKLAEQLELSEQIQNEVQNEEELKAACFQEIDARSQRGERVLILLDEMSSLYKADDDFMKQLRSRKDKISVLFVSFLEDEIYHSEEKRHGVEMASSSHSPSLNHFVKVHLPELSVVDVSHQISALLFGSVDYGHNLAPGFVQAITLLSGGNICMIKFILSILDAHERYDWQKTLAPSANSPGSFLADMVAAVPQFYDRVSFEFQELVIAPYEGSKAFGISASLVLKKLIEMAFKKGSLCLRVDHETFGKSFFRNLDIPEENIVVFYRILNHFEGVGLIHRDVVDGETQIYFTSFPLFFFYGRQTGEFSEEQIIRIWNGETITPEQAQKELKAVLPLTPRFPVTEDKKRELIVTLTNDNDRYFNGKPEYKSVDLSYWLNSISSFLEADFRGKDLVQIIIKFDGDNACLLPLISNVVGSDLSRLVDFMLCVWQIGPQKFTVTVEDELTSLNINAQVASEALALYFAQKTNENYFPNWHDVKVNRS